MKKCGLIIIFTQEHLSVALKCFAQGVTNCLQSSAENTKGHVLQFNNHNSGSTRGFGTIALSYPLKVRVRVMVRVKPRFFMMNHQ